MSLYVDPLVKTRPTPEWPWTQSCFLYGDMVEQLHAVAEKLGLKKQFFIDDVAFPRYRIRSMQRVEAMKCGAVEHTRWECIYWVRRRYDRLRGSL